MNIYLKKFKDNIWLVSTQEELDNDDNLVLEDTRLAIVGRKCICDSKKSTIDLIKDSKDCKSLIELGVRIEEIQDKYNIEDIFEYIVQTQNPTFISPDNEDTPSSLIKKLGKFEYVKESKNNKWYKQWYEKMGILKANNIGNVGEYFLRDVCVKTNIEYEYKGSKNKRATDGTYDMKILNKRIEVKTARIGLGNTFQHENMRKTGCDYYIFLNILPNICYLTILKKFIMTEKHPIFGITPHLRKGTTDVYKITLSLNNLKKGIENGITIKISHCTNYEHINKFIVNMIK
jgi:hypothetical protein